MHKPKDGLDVDSEGCGDGLVAVTVEAVVDVSGVGHDATAAVVAGNVAIIARCAVLGIEAVPAWIVHELALAAIANACGVVRVVAVAAAVVGDAGDIGVGDGERVTAVVDVAAVVARCLAFCAVVGVVVADKMNLCLL